MKKKCTAPLSIAVMAMSLLTLTSCGNTNDTSVSAMNEIPMPTETSTIEEATSIETENDTETETTTTATIEETTTIETDTEIQSETEAEEKKETDIDNKTSDFVFTITPLSQIMYTQKECNIRKKPSTEYEILDCLTKATEVEVTGKVNEADWYEVSIGEEKGYIAGSLLGMEKPVENQATPSTNTDTGTPNPSTGTITDGAGYKYTPNGDGTYTSEAGYKYGVNSSGEITPINPSTGKPLEDGERDQNGWLYHGYDPNMDF